MIKAVIFDLDGTLYIGETPVPGAIEKVREIQEKGKRVFFITNAATRTREGVAAKLRDMGFPASKEQVYSSAYILARFIKERYWMKKVFVVGEQGIYDELHAASIKTVDECADIVVVGLDREFNYEKMATALTELQKGAVFIASNMDPTYPTENGERPGAGAIVAAIEYASGKKAYDVGKPNPYTLELLKKEHALRSDEILMVGDRLGTDIKFAKDCSARSALVLTGSTKKEEIKKNGIEPDYVFDSVANLPSDL